MKSWAVLALLLFACSSVVAQQAATVDRARLEARLAAVLVLIEKSTAARQIESSGDTRALTQRAQARALHRKAQEAFDRGDLDSASRLLPEASMAMFEAVRLAAPEQVQNEKARSDFESRLESVRSLLAAQKRITAEKPNTPGAREATATVEKRIAEARALADANRIGEARARLDEAYLVAKASISAMRSGDTLVRSLKFETKEDEYKYELDRNDTHRMLIRLLVENKRSSADPLVVAATDKAGGLRSQSDAAAAKGDFIRAIQLLEESTAELVRAIRSAGVFIPG